MKGGARSRSGPAPDPNALHRERDAGDFVKLPRSGREGATPDWPLAKQTRREAELWELEWRRPQAIMWERNGQELEVALYVRSVVAAEKTSAAVSARTLVRQQQDALGLSVPGLLRNRWVIVGDEAEAAESAPPARRSARERLKVVEGGAAS